MTQSTQDCESRNAGHVRARTCKSTWRLCTDHTAQSSHTIRLYTMVRAAAAFALLACAVASKSDLMEVTSTVFFDVSADGALSLLLTL